VTILEHIYEADASAEKNGRRLAKVVVGLKPWIKLLAGICTRSLPHDYPAGGAIRGAVIDLISDPVEIVYDRSKPHDYFCCEDEPCQTT
jgi:hypothetical protein